MILFEFFTISGLKIMKMNKKFLEAYDPIMSITKTASYSYHMLNIRNNLSKGIQNYPNEDDLESKIMNSDEIVLRNYRFTE